jgi:hypothetical protein
MKKKLIIIAMAMIIGAGLFLFWREKSTWSWQDYSKCADAGYSTIEPNPPTCFHPDGNITPGAIK